MGVGFVNKAVEKIYVGEYSKEQDSYYVETLIEAISENKEMFYKGTLNGYMPICYGSSYEEVSEKLEIMRKEKKNGFYS